MLSIRVYTLMLSAVIPNAIMLCCCGRRHDTQHNGNVLMPSVIFAKCMLSVIN